MSEETDFQRRVAATYKAKYEAEKARADKAEAALAKVRGELLAMEGDFCEGFCTNLDPSPELDEARNQCGGCAAARLRASLTEGE